MPSTPSKTTATPKGKKPTDHKPKQQFGKKLTFELELPSGVTVTVRRPGIQGLIKAGILESMDSLSGIVQTTTIPNAEGKPKVDASKLLEDADKMKDMILILDKIAVHVVQEPRLSFPPVPVGEDKKPIENPSEAEIDALRDDDAAYVDYVDDEDKTFIMNFALGGSADLADFRSATEEALGGVPAVEAAADAPE